MSIVEVVARPKCATAH